MSNTGKNGFMAQIISRNWVCRTAPPLGTAIICAYHTDLNCLSVIQYAVDFLHVAHIIVTGHYGCGGVLAALRDDRLGLVDNWLRHVQDVQWKHQAELASLDTEAQRHNRLCELNVLEQVTNVSQTTVVRDAWARKQPLTVHGWIYDLHDGLLRDLGVEVSAPG